MTLKTRLITTISMFCLVIALLITGVWAVSTANVNIGGTISFNATNIYATITGSISGATTTPTLSPLNYSAKSIPSTTELNTWKQNLTFADATIPTIKWTVTIENKSERALYVTLTDNIANLSNATKTLTFDNGSADGEKTIPAKTTKVYTMEIKVTDTNASASVEYDFNFDLRDESYTPKVNLQQDDKGFYVTMGTYNNAPVVWRLVGLNGNKFTGTTKPTSGTGTFILETLAPLTHNDATTKNYVENGIFSYLSSGYLTAMGIQESDEVYSQIQERSVQDLYTDIGWATSLGTNGMMAPPSGTTKDSFYTVETDVEGTAKLWLMSIKELYTLVGGGTINADGTIGVSWESDIKSNLVWGEGYVTYATRTPRYNMADVMDAKTIYNINTKGEFSGFGDFSYPIRPAFNLEF